ncbi:MAG: serine/threonine-protein kinase [Anaerolineae bacterium]|jgi:serine/threonine protein kinase|nr:serine/threonine-protein kinase [Anaerolineae bacterium]
MPETTQFGDSGNSGGMDGTLKVNTILLARYKIDAMLGGGGQGAVYRARDLNFPEAKRLVAVKEMLITAADPGMRASSMKTFQREANILATLTHPAIPRIYDFFDQNDRAYLVMEYINGRDLEAILNMTKKLPIEKIIDWAIELCDVLSYLHTYDEQQPIIFRDMKPANIMIDGLGKVRLIDFGIAKVFIATDKKHTQIGTEGYSAPEQYKGQANPLSDIYALGATLHHVITRKDPRLETPFSFPERPMKDFNPDVSAELQMIIDRAVAYEAKDRWQACADMKAAFEALRYRPMSVPAAGALSAGAGAAAAAPAAGGMGAPMGTTIIPEGDDLSTSIQPRWKFKTEDEIRGGAVVGNGLVFVGSYDTNLWAVKLEDGSFVWKRPSDDGVATTPALSEEDTRQKLVFFGSEDYTLYAVESRDGRVQWTHKTGDKIRSSPRTAHGHVFFGSDDGNIYAILASTGRLMWSHEVGSPIRCSPCVTGDRIIFGTDTGEVIGMDLSGSRRWALRTKRPIYATPFVDQDNVAFIASMDNHVYALDADNGLTIWRLRTGGSVISSPVVDRNLVYFGSTDGKFYAINTQVGKEKWVFEAGKPIVGSPVVHEGTVYFGAGNTFYAISAKDGKKRWQFEAGKNITAAPCIAGNLIIFGSHDQYLYALPLIAS